MLDSDPSVVERLSAHNDHTDATLDYSSDADTYIPPRPHVGSRASRWSLEPLPDQEVPSRSSLESGWTVIGGLERHQYPTPMEGSTYTGLGGMRGIATALPDFSPEAGRSRREEQRQSPRNYSGSVMQSSRPRSAGILTELGEFARTSRDHRVMRSFSSSGSDQHFYSTIPPPSYHEATDSLVPVHGQRHRLQFGEPHVDAQHAAYDAPLHQETYQTSRPLPAIPRRYDERTTPMDSTYLDHIRSREGQLLFLHRQSMKKPAVAISAASECTKERPNTPYTQKSLYCQDPASSEAFDTREYDLEDIERPESHVLDNENYIAPYQSSERYHNRSVTPTVDPTRDRTSQTEPSMPTHTADTPVDTRPAVVTTSVPSLPLRATTMQAEPDLIEASQATQTKQLSKIERALLRRAAVNTKADSPQP